MRALLIVKIFVGVVLGSVEFTRIVQYDKLVSITQTTPDRLFLVNPNTLEWTGAIYNNDRLAITASHANTCLFTISQSHSSAPYHLNPVRMTKDPWEVVSEALIRLSEGKVSVLVLMPTKKRTISCREWMKKVHLNRVMSPSDLLKWGSKPRSTEYAAVQFTVMLKPDFNTLENSRSASEDLGQSSRHSDIDRQSSVSHYKPPAPIAPRKPRKTRDSPAFPGPLRVSAARRSSERQKTVRTSSRKPIPNESLTRGNARESFRTWSAKSVQQSTSGRNSWGDSRNSAVQLRNPHPSLKLAQFPDDMNVVPEAQSLYMFNSAYETVSVVYEKGKVEFRSTCSNTCVFQLLQPQNDSRFKLKPVDFPYNCFEGNHYSTCSVANAGMSFLILVPTKDSVVPCTQWMDEVELHMEMEYSAFDEWTKMSHNGSYEVVGLAVRHRDNTLLPGVNHGFCELPSMPFLLREPTIITELKIRTTSLRLKKFDITNPLSETDPLRSRYRHFRSQQRLPDEVLYRDSPSFEAGTDSSEAGSDSSDSGSNSSESGSSYSDSGSNSSESGSSYSESGSNSSEYKSYESGHQSYSRSNSENLDPFISRFKKLFLGERVSMFHVHSSSDSTDEPSQEVVRPRYSYSAPLPSTKPL
ncbi:hypothetical protein PSACC_00955 [Paramicrosporidium saccamoebae]|uniref:Uncharacterized protein n=1 Tax=Paramicrosporidium saccamoebae TaxID=1246581 RepID=A0A2H9TNH8_9FUNG|nr:hypothetical protein PSACC_00955 [Paramicrosporidium saccamoebae]